MNAPQKKFLVELIKPSHYDDQGYIIQWWRGFVPSNSLSCLYGLALDVADRRALGDDVDIDIEVRDETNVFIPVKKIIRRFAENGNSGLVCLVGVQTNQFARAVDIARELRAAGIQVAIGGFHVSGCLAMLPELTPELKEALALGITLFAGEAEGRLEEIFRAAYEHRLAAALQFHEGHAGPRESAAALSAGALRGPLRGEARMLRRRARLPIRLQLLQHHQRAGAQVTIPHRG